MTRASSEILKLVIFVELADESTIMTELEVQDAIQKKSAETKLFAQIVAICAAFITAQLLAFFLAFE
jgi:hypothetical protein